MIVASCALMLAIAGCSSGSPEAGNNSAAASTKNPREAKFKAIGKANKAVGEELKKDAPAIEAIKPNAATIAELAAQLPTWFPAGSGPESGIKTEALPAIWEKPDEFKVKAADFDAKAKALVTATAGTDLAAVKASADALGATCKACHISFRQKK